VESDQSTGEASLDVLALKIAPTLSRSIDRCTQLGSRQEHCPVSLPEEK